MKKRVLFIKWYSDDGNFMISQYYISEDFRSEILTSEFSFVVGYLRYLAFTPRFIRDCLYFKSFLTRLKSSFKFGWHIEAFSIYKKSLL